MSTRRDARDILRTQELRVTSPPDWIVLCVIVAVVLALLSYHAGRAHQRHIDYPDGARDHAGQVLR